MRSPAAVAFNPAALPEGWALSGSLHAIVTDPEPGLTDRQAVPALYGTGHGMGLGVYGPFGMATDYPDHWPGRFAALRSEIEAARLQLAGGFEALPGLRLGAGMFLQRFRAELSSAVPLGPGAEGRIQVDGEDTAPGWSLGLLWSPSETLDLGLAYSSAVHHTLEGDASLPLGGTTGTETRVTTPESLSLGLRWSPAERWTVLAGVDWTRWSRLQDLDIRLDSGAVLHEAHHWRDTWRLALGAEHTRGPWTLRAGLAWDQSPVPDAAHRYPRLPDRDRYWLALGIGRAFGAWRVDLGYAHVFVDDGAGEHPPVRYRSATDVFALSLSAAWE